MANLRMLDFYKNLSNDTILKNNEYFYINSIEQSEVQEIIRTDMFIDNIDTEKYGGGRNF